MVADEDDVATIGDVPILDAKLAIASSCSISVVIDCGDNCE